MIPIILDAVVTNGMLKPTMPLRLPEGAKVQVQLTLLPQAEAAPTTFGELAGVWSHLSDDDMTKLERALQETRAHSTAKIEALAQSVSKT